MLETTEYTDHTEKHCQNRETTKHTKHTKKEKQEKINHELNELTRIGRNHGKALRAVLRSGFKVRGSGFRVLGFGSAAVPQDCQCIFNRKDAKGCAAHSVQDRLTARP